jgi:hypothetical protein
MNPSSSIIQHDPRSCTNICIYNAKAVNVSFFAPMYPRSNKRQIMADSYSDQNWLLQSLPSLYLPLSYSIISPTHTLLKKTYLLSAYQSVKLLLISYTQTLRRKEPTPHRSATVVNSFPTPYTSSSFRLRTFVWDSNSSKF